MKKFARLPLALLSMLIGVNAHAIPDLRNDFLPSFTGAHNAAFDIRDADVTFNTVSNQFTLHVTTDGPIAGAPGVAYVFGFDVGGTLSSPFGTIGEPAVAFNKTVTLRSDGTGTVGSQGIGAQIDGADIFALVSASLLPSTLLAPENYRWSLWTIDSTVSGLARNADFAPDGDANVTVVPEPPNSVTMLTGLALLGFTARRRFRQ
ncbi:MAG: hypothetical protein V4508_02610 [Pseudomonadota bacterium]